jgi:two-component system response regulator DctR
VEDQPLVSEILIDLLGRYDHPSQANSGKDALKQIKNKVPDVILLDLSLSDMNGLEVARLASKRKDMPYSHSGNER